MNRWFLIETVRWLVREAGIRQILDIGSGLPTQQNVHEVAQAIDPNAKVVYVDNDPLVRVHAEALLATNPNTIFLTADLRDPNDLLNRPEIRSHLDFSQPIALLLVAVLHFIEDTQQAYDVVKVLCDALPSGSYLAISHGLIEEGQKEATQQASAVYRRANSGVYPRTREEILGFFTGLTPVGCGLVHISEWTPPAAPPAPQPATTSCPWATPPYSGACRGCAASPASTARPYGSRPPAAGGGDGGLEAAGDLQQGSRTRRAYPLAGRAAARWGGPTSTRTRWATARAGGRARWTFHRLQWVR